MHVRQVRENRVYQRPDSREHEFATGITFGDIIVERVK
jgi:hypothetical protein